MAWNSPGKGNNSGRQQPPCLESFLRKCFGLQSGKTPGKPTPLAKTLNYAVIAGLIAAGLLGLWVLSGVYSVAEGEQAIILQLGQYKATETAGLHWYPRLIDTKYQVAVTAKRTVKITQTLLTRDTDLVGVNFNVQYRISDLNAYLFTVADADGLLSQIASNAAEQVVASHTFAELTLDQGLVAGELQQKIMQAAAAAHLGLSVTDLTMQPLHVPPAFKQDLEKLAKLKLASDAAANAAKVEAAQVIAVANGNGEKLIAGANAYKQQALYNAEGEVAGFNALLPMYLTAPKFVTAQLYYDTLQQVFANSHVVLTDVNNFTYQASSEQPQVPVQTAPLMAVKPVANSQTNLSPLVNADNLAQQATAYQRWQEAE